jgi:hypothetical protein
MPQKIAHLRLCKRFRISLVFSLCDHRGVRARAAAHDVWLCSQKVTPFDWVKKSFTFQESLYLSHKKTLFVHLRRLKGRFHEIFLQEDANKYIPLKENQKGETGQVEFVLFIQGWVASNPHRFQQHRK